MTTITNEQLSVAMDIWFRRNIHADPEIAMREALQAALSLPVSNTGEWQPIETAPKDGHLLVSDGENSRWVATWASWWPEPGWCTVPGPYRIRPTHWQPLPEAPNE